jgi:YidC/Oxa1 family membrane protein insertase
VSQKKEMSQEMRLLLAFVLTTGVFLLWGILFPPPKPVRPAGEALPGQPPAASAPSATAPGGASPGQTAPTSSAATGKAGAALSPQAASSQTGSVPTTIAAAEEKVLAIENDFYRVELSNRGAAVRSWRLNRYKDSRTKPQTLDVVDHLAAGQHNGWPLSIALDDAQLEQQIANALFVVSPAEPTVRAPRDITFEWSDGRVHVTKRMHFDHSYVVGVETSVTREGQPLAHAIAWRGGFGDQPAYAHAERVRVLYRSAGAVHYLEHGKLGQPERRDQRLRESSTFDYAGIEDQYFAAVFLPQGARANELGTGLALWHWKLEAEKEVDKARGKVPVAEMAAGTTVPGPVSLRLFVGPKDVEVVSNLSPPMPEIVDFGWDWLEVFAKPLFGFLKWIYGYTRNYGWAIVLMTLAINIVLFPLKVKSWRSMQKMQKVMPEIQQIKQKYAKYSLTDPRKQEEQQQMMAVYKREGVNPVGGCLPMALQMPIWFALYQMLMSAIELRHAPWLGWIHDLSAPDPYRILPIGMGVTMYLMQKMTPVTTPDPVQQKMMNIMPIMFGGIFIVSPVSSGLVLYILTSNVIGIAQQWFLNKTSPLPAAKK